MDDFKVEGKVPVVMERFTIERIVGDMPGSRRRKSRQAAVLGGDKRATTMRSDGRVLSLFKRQSNGTVGKTVRQ